METTISIPVDAKLAERFSAENSSQRKYLELQLQFRLYELLFGPDLRTFEDLANDLGRQARENGLTPEILEEILNEK